MRRRFLLPLLLTVDAATLTGLRHSLPAAGRVLGAPHAALTADPDRALADLCSAALWFVAAWVALGLLAAAASALPGAAGRRAASACRFVLPRALQRVLAGSAGLAVLVAPVAAGARGAATHDPLPAPAWPVSTATAPTPSWPMSSEPASRSQARQSDRTRDEGRSSATHRSHSTDASAAAVTVRPGDSLWLIAARRLGAGAEAHDIAAAWPQLYAANRDVIGDDPARIRPGQVLRVPAMHRAKESS